MLYTSQPPERRWQLRRRIKRAFLCQFWRDYSSAKINERNSVIYGYINKLGIGAFASLQKSCFSRIIWRHFTVLSETPIFFIPPVRPGLRRHPSKFLQFPSRHLRRKTSFSIRISEPTIYVYLSTHLNTNKIGHGSPVSISRWYYWKSSCAVPYCNLFEKKPRKIISLSNVCKCHYSPFIVRVL